MKKILFVPLFFLLFSCVEKVGDINRNDDQIDFATDFEFNTISTENISITLLAPDGSPMNGVLISFLTKSPVDGGEVFLKMITDENGQANSNYNLPISQETAVIQIKSTGFPQLLQVSRQNLFDGILVQGYEHQYTELSADLTPGMSVIDGTYVDGYSNGRIASNFKIEYLGKYDKNGVPNYLETRDRISSELLSYINASLPESLPVPTYHPRFISDNAETTLNITEMADVWITFVHEGAGYTNALGFYAYPTGNPPQTTADISKVTMAFPNTSFKNSGGGLTSGDKVKLGRFEPGTSIGFVLLANGWRPTTQVVEMGLRQVFSHNYLNPETEQTKQAHTVLLYDDKNKLFLLGFEDLNRMEGSDDDFNDAVFYVTSNPVEAIDLTNVNPIDTPLDTDKDGVNDTYDEFPNDPRYAYKYSYPGENSYGTFAFEDQWPGYGDYDFNDLVVDYQYDQYADAKNLMVELRPEFIIKAIGAGFSNAFGVELGIDPSKISSVSGSDVANDLFKLNSNGTEAGQSNAVIIATDDAHRGFKTEGFVNTVVGAQYYVPDTIRLIVSFTTPQDLNATGSAPFNPFLVINQIRGKELHLPGYDPTDLVDESYFGQGNDASDPKNGIYYRSQTGLPWGMNLPVSFDYPKEKASIEDGYNFFGQWAKSMGFSYMDWYSNKSGYRNSDKLYTK